MKRIDTALPGVCIIEPRVFADPRGFFLESYNRDAFVGLGITATFVQDNHSKSANGVLRGLHGDTQILTQERRHFDAPLFHVNDNCSGSRLACGTAFGLSCGVVTLGKCGHGRRTALWQLIRQLALRRSVLPSREAVLSLG